LDDSCAFYAVYEGHGGEAASHYCEKHMKKYVTEKMGALPENPSDEDVEKAFKEAFIALDDKFLQKRVDDGSTACVGYILNNKLYVANAGDTRAIVVCEDGSFVEMSKDHKPDLPEEKKRIQACYHDVEVTSAIVDGKRIKIARVDGVLAVARAIGDGTFKDMPNPAENAVTCVPEVRSLELDPKKHRFLVIACDGIWDVFSNQQVADLVNKHMGSKSGPFTTDILNNIAKIIVDNSIELGSCDNCTAVVVALYFWISGSTTR